MKSYLAVMAYNGMRYVIGAYETEADARAAGMKCLLTARYQWNRPTRYRGAKPQLLICHVLSADY